MMADTGTATNERWLKGWPICGEGVVSMPSAYAHDENVLNGKDNQAAGCGPDECQQLRDRFGIVEAPIRSLETVLASQKDEQKVLPLIHDPALGVILSPTTGHIPANNVTLASDTTSCSSEEGTKRKKNLVHYLKGGAYCSLAHLVDVNYSAPENLTASLAN
ncbi:hypothetical protein OUZ56_020088 [Daphnia magna]|uniref:Uncharacterized protein n=1 Tax=Daphnia magna TaxID=35525 RepID=A0ABQ9ZDH9_9CRUS|nr:hypothetical protein OUZ56_020088 [Daphnia magna]